MFIRIVSRTLILSSVYYLWDQNVFFVYCSNLWYEQNLYECSWLKRDHAQTSWFIFTKYVAPPPPFPLLSIALISEPFLNEARKVIVAQLLVPKETNQYNLMMLMFVRCQHLVQTPHPPLKVTANLCMVTYICLESAQYSFLKEKYSLLLCDIGSVWDEREALYWMA